MAGWRDQAKNWMMDNLPESMAEQIGVKTGEIDQATVDADNAMQAKYGDSYTSVRDTLRKDPELKQAIQTLRGGEPGSELSDAEALKQLEVEAENNPELFNRLDSLFQQDGFTEKVKKIAADSDIVAQMNAPDGKISGDFEARIMDPEVPAEAVVADLDLVLSAEKTRTSLAEMPGFNEFSENFIKDDALRAAVGGITGGVAMDTSTPAGIDAALKGIQTMAGDNPKFFTDLNKVIEAPGAKEFLQTAADNPQMKSFLQNMTGVGGDGAIDPESLGNLEAALEKNSEMFNQLNDMAQMEGFDGTLAHLQKHEGFQDLLSGSVDDPAKAANFVDALHGRASQDPEYFKKVDNLIEDHPGLLTMAAGAGAGSLLDDPEQALSMLDMAVKGNEMFGNFMGGLMDKLMPILGGLIESLAPMLTKAMGWIGDKLDGFSGSSNRIVASTSEGSLTQQAEAEMNSRANLNITDEKGNEVIAGEPHKPEVLDNDPRQEQGMKPPSPEMTA